MSILVNEASIPVLLQEMTVNEKVDLLTGWSAFSTLAFPKYGIPSVRYMDGCTGANMLHYIGDLSSILKLEEQNQTADVVNESGAASMELVSYITGSEPIPDNLSEQVKGRIYKMRSLLQDIRPAGEEPGCFPPGMLLGATWDPETVYQVAEAVSREAQAYGIDVLLGTPNINIHRDPKNGRLFESFSEDPYLSAKLAPAMVQGVQDQGMVADVKHFAANNQETLRQGIDEQIGERALREIYLPGFEAAVKKGNVGTVMSAYNSINGIPCAHNHWLLTEVLKEEWEFDGQVVSDWGGAYDQVKALNAGNDLDMPGPRSKEKVYEAVENGTIPMERLDDAVSRMLKVILKTPAFQGKRYPKIDNVLSQQSAYNAAAGGITLLKNDGVLPLERDAHIALIGELNKRFMESGSGSAQVDTKKYTSLLTEVVRYTGHSTYGMICEDCGVVIITVGASGQEGSDRAEMDLDHDDKILLRESLKTAKQVGKKTVVLLNTAGPVELSDVIDQIDALVMLYFPGMEGARATADILFGTISPSGKLPLTFPKTYRDTPTSINFPGEYGKVYYGEGIFVGYRYYDYKHIEPLYPFGFGLSYSSFELRNLHVSAQTWNYQKDDPLVVSVDVTNMGHMPASEVIQLYIHDPVSTLQKPDQELKGFSKVHLLPGETKTVQLVLDMRSFAAYDTDLHQWTVEPGTFELRIGTSSRHICLTHNIIVKGSNPYGYSVRTAVAKVNANPEVMLILRDELGAFFNSEIFKTYATYFAAMPLKAYLRMIAPAELLSQITQRLNERFAQIENN